MVKVVIITLTIAVLTGSTAIAVPHITSAVDQTEDQSYSIDADNFVEEYPGTIASILNDAGEDIQDRSLANFYDRLLQEYSLDQTSSEESVTDTSLEEALPDIGKIHKAAMTLPLEEAGKTIQDEDIALFYHNFLNSAGWEVESK